MDGFSHALRRSANAAHGLRVMNRAGLVRGFAVGRAIDGLRSVRRWGPLVSALRHAVSGYPNAIALIDEIGPLAYRDLDVRSDRLAAGLRARGLRPGETVAILCRDHRWMVESLLACGKLGLHVLLLNTGFAAPQLADVLQREKVRVLVHDEEFTDLVARTRVGLPRLVAWISAPHFHSDQPTLEHLIAQHGSEKLDVPPTPSKVILLTSGTTGRPKGAGREIRSALTAADFLDRIPLRVREATFVAAPMFHAVGFSQLSVGLALGSTLVVHRRFDAQQVVRAVHEHQCSALVLVPTMLHRILDLDDGSLAASLRSLRVVLVSGSPLPPVLCERTTRSLGDVLYNLYGSTEAAVVTVATPEELRLAPGTVGRPPHSCTLEILDERGRPITRPHVPGRVFSGSNLSFKGYTDGGQAETSGGLIGTGDLGHLDENGLLFIDGRSDDMIISGGENVFPTEVENLIARHYQVKDVAVVGVPDREFGQRLRAFVVPIPGSGLDKEEVRDYVRASLAKHKVPRDVVMVGTVPRNATGKILRRNLMNPVNEA